MRLRHFGAWHEALVAAALPAAALSDALGDRRQWTKSVTGTGHHAAAPAGCASAASSEGISFGVPRRSCAHAE